MECYYCKYETRRFSQFKGQPMCLECQEQQITDTPFVLNAKSATVGSKNHLDESCDKHSVNATSNLQLKFHWWNSIKYQKREI